MAVSNRFQTPADGADPSEQFKLLAGVVDQLAELPQYKPSTDAVVQVSVGGFKRLAPRAGTQQVVIPRATPDTFGKAITLIVEASLGNVRVRAVSGTINGQTAYSISAGNQELIVLVSNGNGGWFTQDAGIAMGGSVFNVNVDGPGAALGVVDVSTLSRGGILSYQNVPDTDTTISGFSVKPDGFWFILNVRDATTAGVIKLLEDVGTPANTGIRTPDIRDMRLYKNDSAILVYINTRWRVVAAIPRLFLTGVLTPAALAARTDNLTRTSSGQSRVRVTMTGSQTLTGVVPDQSTNGSPNGEIMVIDNIDTVDILTLDHESANSSAVNRFTLPDARPFMLLPRQSATFAYDDTTQRWRLIGSGVVGYALTLTTQQTVNGATTNLTAGTLLVPANSLAVGSEFEFRGLIHTARGATATASNVVVQLVAAGVTKQVTIATTVVNGDLGYAILMGRMTVRTAGAGGTFMPTLQVEHVIATAAGGNPAVIDARVIQDPAPSVAVVAASAINTTVDQTLELRAGFSAGVANLIMHMYECSIKRVK